MTSLVFPIGNIILREETRKKIIKSESKVMVKVMRSLLLLLGMIIRSLLAMMEGGLANIEAEAKGKAIAEGQPLSAIIVKHWSY